VFGEEVLKYLLKFNTEEMKTYVNKTILKQICHSLERTNRSFGIQFVYFDFSQIHRNIFVTCCKLQTDTKPDFYLLRTNSCFYMKIALYFEVMKMKYGRFLVTNFSTKNKVATLEHTSPPQPIFF
jgi:hypothetical protein